MCIDIQSDILTKMSNYLFDYDTFYFQLHSTKCNVSVCNKNRKVYVFYKTKIEKNMCIHIQTDLLTKMSNSTMTHFIFNVIYSTKCNVSFCNKNRKVY